MILDHGLAFIKEDNETVKNNNFVKHIDDVDSILENIEFNHEYTSKYILAVVKEWLDDYKQ